MRRVLAWSLTLFSLTIGGPTRLAFGQAASIPLSLGVAATPTEVAMGGAVAVVVRLKNYAGDTVAASEAITVTLHSEMSGDTSLTFRAGQSTAEMSVSFHRAGVATLVATAPKMSSGSAVVVVKAVDEAQARRPVAAAAPLAAPPPVSASRPKSGAAASGSSNAMSAAASKAILELDVMPQHVHPANAAWRTQVLVTAVTDTRQPIAVDTDTNVYLATDIGVVTPTQSHIQAGKARTAETIQLTSTRRGNGTLWAWTDTGALATAAVEYHDATPTQLLVRGLPIRAVNDGRTSVNVTVFLQDESGGAASADQDTLVKLTSSVGTPTPSDLTIPKGKFFAEAVLTSPTSGTAQITATAPELTAGLAQVEFVFPTMLVVLAAVGGMIGSAVRSGQALLKGVWWHLLGSLGLGLVLGLVFYALAMFGIIASIPKLSIPLGQLPTTNDLGALVLGFFGGYYARSWLPDPDVKS